MSKQRKFSNLENKKKIFLLKKWYVLNVPPTSGWVPKSPLYVIVVPLLMITHEGEYLKSFPKVISTVVLPRRSVAEPNEQPFTLQFWQCTKEKMRQNRSIKRSICGFNKFWVETKTELGMQKNCRLPAASRRFDYIKNGK